MSGGRGVGGNREVSPLVLPRSGGSGRIDTIPEATPKEGGSWGKHGFPHGSEQKASDAHTSRFSARKSRIAWAALPSSTIFFESPRGGPNRIRSACSRSSALASA